MSKRKPLALSDLIEKAFLTPIKTDLTYSTDGAAWKVKANVAEAARQGFTALIAGSGKFAAIEVDVSNEFGAPECYNNSESNGYQPLRDFLQLAYPGFSVAQQFIDQQNKLPVEKRDGAGMSVAEAHINRSRRLIQQAIGFIYSAFKARTNPARDPAEAQTAQDFMRTTVIPALSRMAGDKSKLTPVDKRIARFWLNWVTYAQENKSQASAFLAQHTLNTLQAAQAGKPAPVTTLTPDQVKAVNEAIDKATTPAA